MLHEHYVSYEQAKALKNSLIHAFTSFEQALSSSLSKALEYLRNNPKNNEKWEYKQIIAGRGGGIIPSQLEEMKAEGWQLYSQNGLEYIFKRKIQQG